MGSWREMPSLLDGYMQLSRGLRRNRGSRTTRIRRGLGFARRQPSSECHHRRPMVRRRTSPHRSDDSQPVKTEAVCKRWASSPGRKLDGLRVRSVGVCNCGGWYVSGSPRSTRLRMRQGQRQSGKTQERDDSAPTLAHIGTRSGPRDRRRRATSSSIRVSCRTRSRASSDDPAQEPARSFGSVQNRRTSSGESLVCEQLMHAYTRCAKQHSTER